MAVLRHGQKMLSFFTLLLATAAASALHDNPIDPIKVSDTGLNKAYNIFLRSFGILIYALLLAAICYNIIVFVIGK